MKPLIYASQSADRTKREKEHCELARRICSEGIVLLENNGILPLKDLSVDLYGAGARHAAFGGTGSGENNPRYNITPEEGLTGAGIKITSKDWLDEYDRLYETELSIYRKKTAKALKKVPIAEHMDYTADNPFYPPAGALLGDDHLPGSDTAVFILTRQAGEGSDRKDIPGDYYVTEDELALMRSVTEKHKDTILVLNTGSVIDLKFTDEIRFSAIILLVQGGMETGNALADILTGKVNPSGRLTDTWGNSYSDYPCAASFSERSPEQYQEYYNEGIFVGYRWFERNNIRPRYPFGYGLSYTSFEITFSGISVSGTEVSINASVKNTGKISGKEVVMLFISFPENRFIRENRSLAAFTKTALIEPGKSVTVTLSSDISDHALFDEEKAEFILEKGDYVLYLNNNPVYIAELDKDVITEKAKTLFKTERKNELLIKRKSNREIYYLPRVKIDTSKIPTKVFEYDVPAMDKDEQIDTVISKLSYKDMARLLVGRTYFGPYRHRVFGAVGYTTSKLFHKGVDGMPMADGPQGLNLTSISKKPLHNLFAIPTLPESIRTHHKVSKLSTADAESGKKLYYQFCTSWPSETSVAQTWNTELARIMGDAVGVEMEEFGVVFWLAPAMNIHRNPLCGRNFEYYSEDPVLTGNMAAAVTEGVQAHEGCYVTLKHFAANNLETKRNVSSSNVDERTLREIYLKAFKLAIGRSNPKSIMCSYNKINGVYTALDYNLQTNILRNEWGFDGIVMTDWFATGHHESLDELCCKAGTDLIMPGLPFIPSKIMKALKKGLISHDDIERSARRIIKLALDSHTYKRSHIKL